MFAISEAPKDAINPCEDISGIKDSEVAISEEDLEDRETSKVSQLWCGSLILVV